MSARNLPIVSLAGLIGERTADCISIQAVSFGGASTGFARKAIPPEHRGNGREAGDEVPEAENQGDRKRQRGNQANSALRKRIA
jgi:hypothetical protein